MSDLFGLIHSIPLHTGLLMVLFSWHYLQNNPDQHSLESRLLDKLKGDTSNDGKILITLEHIAEWQPDCWERRSYKYSK